ncbi:hypothetical protein FB451DRAFT_1413357 [Mycena latifolia]|nr:hypothetical protein FB451DRAFT_1413357 [Mycena latifolia]
MPLAPAAPYRILRLHSTVLPRRILHAPIPLAPVLPALLIRIGGRGVPRGRRYSPGLATDFKRVLCLLESFISLHAIRISVPSPVPTPPSISMRRHATLPTHLCLRPPSAVRASIRAWHARATSPFFLPPTALPSLRLLCRCPTLTPLQGCTRGDSEARDGD